MLPAAGRERSKASDFSYSRSSRLSFRLLLICSVPLERVRAFRVASFFPVVLIGAYYAAARSTLTGQTASARGLSLGCRGSLHEAPVTTSGRHFKVFR